MFSCGNTSMISTIITSCYYSVEIHPLLCLQLENSTMYSRMKCSTYVNHGSDETRNQKHLIFRGKKTRFRHLNGQNRQVSIWESKVKLGLREMNLNKCFEFWRAILGQMDKNGVTPPLSYLHPLINVCHIYIRDQ